MSKFVRKFIIRNRGDSGEIRSGNYNSGIWAEKVGCGLKKRILISPNLLTNFEVQKDYEKEPRFNGVFPRDNLPKTIKIGAYVINLDELMNILDCFIFF